VNEIELASATRRLESEAAASENLLRDLNRILSLARSNRIMGAGAALLGLAALALSLSAWPVTAFMVGLGGWVLATAIAKQNRAKQDIKAVEARLLASQLKLTELRESIAS
jgi:type IV secretory pathway TrbD component